MTNYILYCNKGSITAKGIANYLSNELETPTIATRNASNIQSGSNVIRYGSTEDPSLENRCNVIQTSSSIRNSCDKYGTLKRMSDNNILVPKFSTNFSDFNLNSYPLVGRNNNHVVGEKISLILQKSDIRYASHEYFLKYIPTKEEFRVYLFDNEIFDLSIKGTKLDSYILPMYMRKNDQCKFISLRSDGESNAKFPDETRHLVPEAIKLKIKEVALKAHELNGLIFGAMDIIWGEDEQIYFLEENTSFGLVNTNPCPVCDGEGCDECNDIGQMTTYTKRFKVFCELLKDSLSQNPIQRVISNMRDDDVISIARLRELLNV